MKEETRSPLSSQVGKFSTEQALEYLQYCLELEEQEFPFSMLAPTEYFMNKEEENG